MNFVGIEELIEGEGKGAYVMKMWVSVEAKVCRFRGDMGR